MRFRRIAVAACFALATTIAPLTPAARAETEPQVERWDWDKFFTYASCAAGIGLALGTGAVVLAGLACAKAVTTYWTT